VLVVTGQSQTFNPTLDPAMIAAALASDPEAAASEWAGEFRRDLGALFDEETITGAVNRDRPLELPPRSGVEYRAFVDTSGGASGGDAYTIALSHKEVDAMMIDVVRGVVGKFDPQEVPRQYAALCKEYGIGTVCGDRYAGEWVVAAWRECGIVYQRVEMTKSAIYLEVVPLFTRGLARLPDHARLLRELRFLERRSSRSGKDIVDHARGAADDHAAAVAGALMLATSAPALWHRAALLVDGRPAVTPPRCEVIYAVLLAGQREAAASTSRGSAECCTSSAPWRRRCRLNFSTA
jgi:hypothetical protein